jgi:hypothetical protein
MGDSVRILNEKGIQKFREYLGEAREGAIKQPPTEILTNPFYSLALSVDIEVEDILFGNKYEMARYFNSRFYMLSHSEIEKNTGFWSWLALYYFDQLCPANSSGKRSPGQDYRYILEKDYRRYYKHLLAGTYNIFLLHEDRAPLLLSGAIDKSNKFYLELSSRQGLITNRGVIEAANLLYFDIKQNRPKRGAAVTVKKPGTILRFIDVIQQLDLTHDLYSMTGKEVLELMPSEFNEWKAS